MLDLIRRDRERKAWERRVRPQIKGGVSMRVPAGRSGGTRRVIVTVIVVAAFAVPTMARAHGDSITACNDTNGPAGATEWGEVHTDVPAGLWTFTITDVSPDDARPGNVFVAINNDDDPDFDRAYPFPHPAEGAQLTEFLAAGDIQAGLIMFTGRRGICLTVSVEHP